MGYNSGMSYTHFLLTHHQLSTSRKARIVVDGHPIFVEESPCTKKWTLRTEVHPNHHPDVVRSLRWQERGAYLQQDRETETVQLIQEIPSSKKYIFFRQFLHDFANVANEWREIFGASCKTSRCAKSPF